MKKIVSLLLVIASLLSLTACGGNSAPAELTTAPHNSTTPPIVSGNESNSTDPTTETSPEAEPFPFAGTWRKIQKTAEKTETCYVIDEDGNMKHYITADSEPYEYQLANHDFSATDRCFTFRNEYGTTKTLEFEIKDSLYYISEYASSYGYTYFYREEDYTDYDIIELTTENVTQYLDTTYHIWHDKDDYGDITSIYADPKGTFKEGLGLGSFLLGQINYNYSYKMLTYNPNTGEYTVGETVSIWECNYTDEFKFCAIGDYKSTLIKRADTQENGDGTYLLKDVRSYEFTGAEKVIGKVYVPKGWNG